MLSGAGTARGGREKDQQQDNGKQQYGTYTLYNSHKEILYAAVSLGRGRVMPGMYLPDQDIDPFITGGIFRLSFFGL